MTRLSSILLFSLISLLLTFARAGTSWGQDYFSLAPSPSDIQLSHHPAASQNATASTPTPVGSSVVLAEPFVPMPEVDARYVPPGIAEDKKEPPKKYPDFKVTGFFQVDSAYFGQSAESVATLGDIQDGTGFRRARLAATGNFVENGSYMMEFDMAQGQARFVDVWGQFSKTPVGNVRVGRFRQPFGMSELSSVRELPLLERPVTFAISPFRQTGIMLFDTAYDERMTWAVSGFRAISDNFGNVYGDSSGYGTAERLSGLLFDEGDCRLLHIGLGHSYLDPGRNQWLLASQDEIFIGQNPNFGPGGFSVSPITNVPPFVNSGTFDLDHANLFNLESAISYGRFLAQSEYRWANLQLPADSATVQAGYITFRYMLTGEVIPYNRQNGVFGRVKPDNPLKISEGKWGAWELVAQLSTVNLNPMFGLAGVPGPTRRLKSGSLGMNWYMFSNAKLQAEWLNGSLNDPVLGDSVSNTYAMRAQFDF